jgi:hypothetical protein
MRLIAMKRKTTRFVALLFAVAAITAAAIWSGSSTPATAQPPCQHDWCDWYEVCRWEYWAWDRSGGWERLHTDGYC